MGYSVKKNGISTPERCDLMVLIRITKKAGILPGHEKF